MKYIGIKIVEAMAMDALAAELILGRSVDISNSTAFEGVHRGYLVAYPDGYQSWCPKAQFEEANRPTEGMSFGHAIEAARKGEKIARAGWNGKNMFVVVMPALNLPPYSTQDTNRKVNDRTAKWIGEDTALNCVPYFAMYAADGSWVPGWLASQTDMLADDWMIV